MTSIYFTTIQVSYSDIIDPEKENGIGRKKKSSLEGHMKSKDKTKPYRVKK